MSAPALSRLLLGLLALPTLVLTNACEPAPPAPHNNNFASATALSSAKGQLTATTVGATLQPGEPTADNTTTVWFRWTAPSTGAVTFTGTSALPLEIEPFSGTVLNHLQALDTGDINGLDQQASFRTTAGASYAIRVSTQVGASFGMSWAISSPPANDHRAAAAPVTGATGSLLSDGTAATVDSTDPKIDGQPPTATLWYRWTAPAAGWYSFDTNGSSVDTALGVYTNAATPQLIDDSSADCSVGDFFDSSGTSVRLFAAAGSSYLVMLSGSASYDPTAASLGGPVQLNWRPDASAPIASGNDAFASPAHLNGTHGSINGTTDGATAQPGEPAHMGLPARNSVWFAWTPPVTADYSLNALASNSNSCGAALSVYTGSSLATLKPVTQVDNGTADAGPDGFAFFGIGGSSAGFESRVHLVAGTTYRIAADRLGQTGPFALQWDIPQAAPVIRSATAGNGSIGVIWSPPPATAGSPRSGYFVTAIPVSDDVSVDSEPLTLPVTSAFTTIHGLDNGTAYRIIIAAVNSSGLGNFAISGPVTPKA
jgi:hypothetical protein